MPLLEERTITKKENIILGIFCICGIFVCIVTYYYYDKINSSKLQEWGLVFMCINIYGIFIAMTWEILKNLYYHYDAFRWNDNNYRKLLIKNRRLTGTEILIEKGKKYFVRIGDNYTCLIDIKEISTLIMSYTIKSTKNTIKNTSRIYHKNFKIDEVLHLPPEIELSVTPGEDITSFTIYFKDRFLAKENYNYTEYQYIMSDEDMKGMGITSIIRYIKTLGPLLDSIVVELNKRTLMNICSIDCLFASHADGPLVLCADKKCRVCEEAPTYSLKCGHEYCRGCITEVYKCGTPLCPGCRRIIEI